MSTILSRLLVAVVLLPPVLLLIYGGGWWLFGLAAGAAALALHEFYEMTRGLRPVLVAGYLGTLAALIGAEWGLAWAVAGFLSTFAFSFVFKGLAGVRPTLVSVAATVLGVAWIGLGLAHVVLIRDLAEHGRLAAFTLLLTVFASDTAAFVTGRLVGRHKLAPHTSPGKTWEGFIAGTIVALLVPFFALYDEGFLDVPESLALGGVIAVAAPIGDLFESALKRDAGVKDTGRLLLGHGGMLDRIDALLFAAVASYYLLLAFGAAS
ncbi:MAG TPA: phosphatidate cytidylyltransferase [Gaiellaceae bacterium]|jgi:phosphatidate cytidylyltransferase|nr:phosphatidate cytidylyltransferase [Gaiellaceae bacterium]